MSNINKITKKITGVEKCRNAGPDSEIRSIFRECALYEDDPEISTRYCICAECECLKEEFKILGVTIKDMEPVCGECGCDLNLKIPIHIMSCPIGKW